MNYSFRNGKYHISVFSSINDLSAKWDEFDSGNLNSKYLSMIENSNPADLNFLYAIVELNVDGKNQSAGLLYFQLLKFTKKNIQLNSFSLNVFTSLFLFIKSIRILVCGNLFAVNFPGIKFEQSMIDYEDMVQIIMKISSNHKNDALVIKDVNEILSENIISEYDLKPYSNDLTMSLSIRDSWETLNDYLNALTKKYKRRAEKIIEAGKEVIRKELSELEIISQTDKIKNLFGQVVSKQTIRMGLIRTDYFLNYKKAFPEEFTFVGYYWNDEMIAFSSYVEHGNILEHHYIGIDYKMNKKLSLYFNILFDGLSKAISEKKEFLELGRTAREAKANLGASPVYFNDFIHLRGGISKFLSDRFGKYFQDEMGESWKDRKPFKSI